MPVKRGGNKPQNAVSATAKDLRGESFVVLGKNKNSRVYDGQLTIPDGFSSHNGVVITTANLAKR